MRIAVFTIDRMLPNSPAELAETIAKHLGNGEMVQVNDSTKPPGRRLRYTIQWIGEAGYVFDGSGRMLGIFADVDALVAHAEAVTT